MTDQATLPAAVPAQTLPAETADASSLMRIIERATMDPAFDVEKLSQLLDVKERWEKAEARKAYHAALARFKLDPPRIRKNATVAYGRTEYSHATLDAVVNAVAPALAREGLSHDYRIRQEGGMITVVCTLTHELGHSDSVEMTAPHDDSGQKNPVQQIASAVTYLRRYTLEAITGLASEDDDDGRGGFQDETISASQIAQINAGLEALNADRPAFLKYLDVAELDDLPVRNFQLAMEALAAKRRKIEAAAQDGNAA